MIKKSNSIVFVLLFSISFIYVMPIIIVNRYYNDDLSRALTGQTGWNGDGRPLTQLLLQLLGGGTKLAVDVAPLPLILGIIVLSYALTVYGQNTFEDINVRYRLVPILLMFIINPFMIYAFSYKYDVISMMLALSIVILVFSIKTNLLTLTLWSKYIFNIIMSVMAGIIIMMLYQPTVGLSIGMCYISICLYLFNIKTKGSAKIDCSRFIGIVIGTLIYKIFIVGIFIKDVADDWRYGASQLINMSEKSFVKQIIINLYNMVLYIYRFYKNNVSRSFVITIMIMCISVHMISLYHLYKICKEKKDNFVYASIKILIVLIAPIAITVGSCAPLALLNDMYCRGTLFLSFGAVLLFGGIEVLIISQKLKKTVLLTLIPMFLYAFSFIYMYGNTSYSQKEYEYYLTYNITADIEELATVGQDAITNEEGITVCIIGNTPMAKEARMLSERYPALREMVPVYINNSGWLGGAWLKRFISCTVRFKYPTQDEIDSLDQIIPDKRNLVYDVYRMDNVYYVKYR